MTITQADKANADKAFDIAFRGDTDGIDTAMAELFARAREAQPTDEDLADEIAEAISDTLDMDWQPSWAAPNIIAIINRERRLAREEGAKAMPDDLTYALRGALRFAASRSAITSAQEQAILAALAPAQIVGGKPDA